ncbi:hypothetical protein [Chryseobacterium sp.]|uniref:hypothetical protein n=1 Tax=Chryseobacterium sp. TaxID=1871047 RepID=UPI000ED97EBF|nr:hypothetical protein [Chryseobacterium sp.]HCA05804.1 hypothetical protein [Chryseobacterium sp.]
MASCFIVFKDGRCFSRRWTGYDYIIRIAIKELAFIENGKPLAEWLELQIPPEDEDEYERAESGYGFYSARTDEWINRHLDTRSLTEENQKLFWKAIENGRIKVHDPELPDYTDLNPEYFDYFYEMYRLSEDGAPPLEYSHWGSVAECDEKNGPGWE